MEKVRIFNRTRLTPTPSGFLHLGNILSFAITAALAEKTGAKIFLRIDDFDMERTNRLYLQDIFDTLNFLEIPWHEGPRNFQEYEQEYSLRYRMTIYNRALQELKENGRVFACICSRAQVLGPGAGEGYPGICREKNIPLDAPGTSWRLDTADEKQLIIKTISGIKNATMHASMKDFIVKKKDGYPAYQLISMIDDLHFGVDLVVRGEDLWPSTLAQQYLSLVLGKDAFLNTTFYHHPLVCGPDGNKLSKSEGATSIYYLRQQGAKPANIYTLVAKALGSEQVAGNWRELVSVLNFNL